MKNIKRSNRILERNKIALLAGLFIGALFLCLPAMSLADISTGQLVHVTATVNGPPPSVAAHINSPTNGQIFTDLLINVNGTCPTPGLVIEIIDNASFVGSDVCRSDGSFALKINLFRGKNVLIAQEFDALGQKGPDSKAVSVSYAPVNAGTAVTTGAQMTIGLDYNFHGYTNCLPGQQMSLPFRIHGGTAPYALHIDWGDGTDKLVSLQDVNQPIIAAHIYDQAGNYRVSVSASDAKGQHALMDIVVIISGKPKAAAFGSISPPTGTYPIAYYPWAALVLLLLGFILGKIKFRHAKDQLKTSQ